MYLADKISFWYFLKGHNFKKGDNLNKKIYRSAIFPWGIHIWNFKTLACTVHKIWHASDFILIFSKGHNSTKGDTWNKKKKRVSAIFPWGIHIWNFKTLACTVFEERTDGQPETNFEVGGMISILYFCLLVCLWHQRQENDISRTKSVCKLKERYLAESNTLLGSVW